MATNVFAWTHADNQAILYNDTTSTFHFQKTGAYQANTNNDQSADFILEPGNSIAIDYWLRATGNYTDNDDALDFTDMNGAGMFTIKGINKWDPTTWLTIGSSLGKFDMGNTFYITTDQEGTWLARTYGVFKTPLNLSIHSR